MILDLVQNAQTVQDARGVRSELKSRPQFCELFGLFDYVRRIAGPGYRQRRGQASDTATDD